MASTSHGGADVCLYITCAFVSHTDTCLACAHLQLHCHFAVSELFLRTIGHNNSIAGRPNCHFGCSRISPSINQAEHELMLPGTS